MRKASICLLVLLCLIIGGSAQNRVPQWKVVKTGILLNGNTALSGTLFTPSQSGLYRITGYISSNTTGNSTINFFWTDINGRPTSYDLTGSGGGTPAAVVLPFFPKAGTPIEYDVFGSYNVAFTLEQLQQ
jgi:hypothetical protein